MNCTPRSRTGRPAVLAVLCVAALLPASAEAQRAEGSFERTLTVAGTPNIEISAGSGSIEVRTGATGRVEVRGRIRAGDWGGGLFRRNAVSAEERVRRVEANPPIEQSGDSIRIGHFKDDDLQEGVSISYTVVLPAPSNLDARSGSGSVDVNGVSGRVEARSGSGSLTLQKVSALRASTGSGSITADGVGGELHATSGSGTIRATAVAGAITAKTGSGGIEIVQVGPGQVDVSSASGSVRVQGVRGGLNASTASGGLTIQGEMAGDWRLSAASGSIRINLPATQGFELDATTGSGSIDVDFPVTVTGTVERRSLKGSAQGGGPLLRIRTSSGGIAVRRAT